MSVSSVTNSFLFAVRTPGKKRSKRELDVIFSTIRRLEPLQSLKEAKLRALCPLIRYEFHGTNSILFKKNEPCRCWYILMSGAVYYEGKMFLPYHSFGKQVSGSKRRGYQCNVLEPSEMIAIDYPEMAIQHSGAEATRPHAMRRTSSTENAMVQNGIETSSAENSPLRRLHSDGATLTPNGQAVIVVTDNDSQLSFNKDLDEDEFPERDADEEDSISLHSTSSFVIKDLVIDVLKKEIDDRNDDDLEILMEFTKSLRAFSNMTEPIRRSLCKVMVFAWVENAETVVLKDNELICDIALTTPAIEHFSRTRKAQALDSWSVIINGQVRVKSDTGERELGMGDSFGVRPTLQAQHQNGTMTTMCDDCQFFCIAQQDYHDVLHEGEENIENITNDEGDIVMVKEKREFENGAKKGNIAIRGTAESLMKHMLEENVVDTTYIEDFLLTYRVFDNDPLKICTQLLEWFDVQLFRDKVIRIILLWVNNHFKDFESNWKMMDLLEKFHEKLHQLNLYGHTKLFNIACSAKAKPRVVAITRSPSEDDLGFKIIAGTDKKDRCPIYVSSVVGDSIAENKGVKRGDQVMEVNGQNFEKLSFEQAQAILKKNTDLSLTLKTNLFAFKEMMNELENPNQKNSKVSTPITERPFTLRPQKITISTSSEGETLETPTKHKKGGTLGRATRKISRMFKKETSNTFTDFMMLHAEAMGYDGGFDTVDGVTRARQNSSSLSYGSPELVESPTFDPFRPISEAPNEVIKVYRADQSSRFIFVNKDTTAGDAVKRACKEFGISDNVGDNALYKVTVQGDEFVKQSKLPDPWSNLSDIALGARYYLKNTMSSEQLLPDENIPDLLKEANFSFLDLNTQEIALYLTREDYKLFQFTEPSNFIDDLFQRGTELQKFKDFQDLVNRELFWVVTTICSEPNVVQRVKIIKHFIKIAHHCKAMKNFNSTFALVSGLGYRAVTRLKQTWEKVPTRSIRLFEELQALMDPSRNMSKYRTMLSEAVHQPPVIPYIPVVKKDLTFLHLGNDTNVNGLVNFEKMRMLSKEVRNICRLCIPDASQIVPVDIGTQKDSDKAIYQTLVRKGRRGSLNNARRRYEDKMNIRKVRQHMQNITVVENEEKLMEMSKVIESAPVAHPTIQKRRHTSNNLMGDSPSRPPKPPSAQLRRNESTGSTSSLVSRSTIDSRSSQFLEPLQQSSKKKLPLSSLPKYSLDHNSPQLINEKLMMLSEELEAESKSGSTTEDDKRSVSQNSQDSSPIPSPIMDKKLKEVENNNVVGFENLNLNNNRRELASAASSTSLDSITELLSEADKKSLSTTSSSGVSSGRGSMIISASLGTVFTSNPSIASLGPGGSPCSSPVSWEHGCSQSHTAPPNLLTLQQKPPSPSRTSSASSTDTIKSGGNRHLYREVPVIKQSKSGRSSSYGGNGMIPINKNERILSQISASSPALSANEQHAPLILPNHPRITRTPSSDSGVIITGGVDPPKTRITKEGEVVNPQDNLPPPNAPATMRRNLPQRPKEPVYSSINKEQKVDNSKTGQEKTKDCDSKEPRKTTVKNIYDFERYVAFQSRQVRPSSMPPCNPVMQPNYLRNLPPDSVLENQFFLELQRQQQAGRQYPEPYSNNRNAQSTYMNWPPLSENHSVPSPGVKDFIYENYAVAQQNYEEQKRKNKSQQHNYINITLPPAAGEQLSTHFLQRQQAVDQQNASDPNSVSERVYANAEIINQSMPPPPPKRTTSIGRPRQLRLSLDSSSGNSPLVSPTSPQFTSPVSPRIRENEMTYATSPSSGGVDHRVLPTYGEAVRQINANDPSSPKNYNPYVEDSRDTNERVSRV